MNTNKKFHLIKSTDLIALETMEASQETALVSSMIELINEHGDLAIDVLNYTKSIARTEKLIEECYDGTYNSKADFIKDFRKNDISEDLECYINYEQMAEDFFEHSFLSLEAKEGKVHIFIC